jgi:tetratricopeptide (TPR) repeat protein
VFFLLIFRTVSRASLLGTVACLGALFLLVMLRRSRKAFVIALIAAPLLMAGGLGGLWFGSATFRERMQPVVRVAQKALSGDWEAAINIDGRPQMWADSLPMVKDRPWCGVGPGNFELTFPEYRHRILANKMLTVHPHNEPIELITEYGMIGTLLFIGALVGFCVPLIHLVKTSERLYHVLPGAAMLAALAGTFVHGLFDFELRIFPNALMLSVLAGCAAAPLLAQRKSKVGDQKSEIRDRNTDSELPDSDLRPPTSFPYRLTSVLRYLISITLLLAAAWAVQVMSSAGLRVYGDHLRLSGERQKAEALYQKAIAIDPQNWRAYLGLGQVYSHFRYYELEPERKAALARQERDIFARAYRHNTKKEEVVYGLGRAGLAAGNREAGLDFLRQAAHYKRFNDFYWRKLGIELRKAGHYEEALEVFLYAQKLDRSNLTVRHNIRWLKKQKSEVGGQRPGG